MDQPFSLTSEVRDAKLILATSGYVNNVGGEAIAQEFQKYFDTGVRHVIINLDQSRVVNSIGMSFLLEIIEQLNDAGGRLVFTNLDPAVDKMLSIMGLFAFAGKANTVDEAVQELASQA